MANGLFDTKNLNTGLKGLLTNLGSFVLGGFISMLIYNNIGTTKPAIAGLFIFILFILSLYIWGFLWNLIK